MLAVSQDPAEAEHILLVDKDICIDNHPEHISTSNEDSKLEVVEKFIDNEKMPSSCIDFGTNQNNLEELVISYVLKKSKKVQTIKTKTVQQNYSNILGCNFNILCISQDTHPIRY